MSSKSWRGTVLFTVILVTMGATVGLKLYGVGDEVSAASSSVHSTASAGSTTSGTESDSSSDASSSGSTTTATPSPSATSSPSASAAAPSATTVITGSAIDTRYGAVQVKVTFSGTTITAVDTIQSPDRDGRDVEINQQALPILQQEVLASQSANIDTVSGATYTSEGYIQSVQSAIDQR